MKPDAVRPVVPITDLKRRHRQIVEGVETIRNSANTDGMAEQVFKESIAPIIPFYYPVTSPLVTEGKDFNTRLLRARKCCPEGPYTMVKELLNPPVASGRAMAARRVPILYAATTMQTCFSESNARIGDRFNIIGLDYKQIADSDFWFVGELASTYRAGRHSHFIREPIGMHQTAYFPEEAKHSFAYQDSMMHEVFSELSSDEDGYALNEFLISAIQEKATNLSGVVYKSVKDALGINFAVYGDAIEGLKIGQLNYIEITDVDNYGYVAWKLLSNGNRNEKGEITWHPFQPPEPHSFSTQYPQ